MTNQQWHGSGTGCPSCNQLNGQVHPAEWWVTQDLYPGSDRLICGSACQCSLTETNLPESGAGFEQNEDETTTLQVKLTAESQDGFEIAIITAGQAEGHPWYYPAPTLQKAVQLFADVPSYVDHEGTADKKRHSAKDLGGTITNPVWNETLQGITAHMVPTGPAAADMRALGHAALKNPKLNIGFSADILQRSKDRKNVDEITSVQSVDAVLSPARGGQFLRALLSQGEETMNDEEKKDKGVTSETTTPDPAEKTRAAMQALLDTQKAADMETAQRAAMQKTHADMCAYLLKSGLSASGLPAPAQARLMTQFKDKVFEASELDQAIKDTRAMLSEIQGENVVQGVGRVSGMFNTKDQLQAAVDDLFLVPRDTDKATLQVAKLQGVKELYLMLTGDDEMTGGYYPSRARLQSTTATFPGLVKNAMNKAIDVRWQKMASKGYAWWEKIVTVEPFESLNDVTWIITGTIASLPTVGEGEEYPELEFGDNAEVTSFTKSGGFMGITIEALDRDDTRRLRMAPGELAEAAIRNISEKVAAIFTQASALGPTLADTGTLFNATAVTTKGGHANLLTTALGTDYTAWKAIAKAMYNQPMLVMNDTDKYGTGKKQAFFPRFCLVPIDLLDAANSLFIPRWEAQAQNVAAVSPTWGGKVEPICVPEWTDTTDYAAVIDPELRPGIMIGTRFGLKPRIVLAGNENDPAMFTNDESRLKVQHFLTVGVADWRALHKENVGG